MGGNIFLGSFLKFFLHFSPQKCSFILPTFLTTFFFSHPPFPGFIMYFFVGGPTSIGRPKPLLFHKFTVAVIILSANFEGPPGSAQVGGPKAAPFGPLDFLQVGGPFREVGGPRPTLDVCNSSTE